MKAGDIYTAMPVFNKLLEEDLPIKTSFALMKAEDEVKKVYELVEAKRIALVDEFGEDGVIAENNVEAANTKFAEILDEDIDLGEFTKVSLPDSVTISAKDLRLVSWVIDG